MYKVGEFGKTLIKFATSQAFSNLLRVISGFLVISLIDPELYGNYSGVGVFLGYILLGHGGIINGLSRELPYELGKGNDEYARQMASSVFVLSIWISVFSSLVFLLFSLYYFIVGEYLFALIFLSYVIIAGLYLLNSQYLPVLYRTNNDFNSLSKQNIFVGIGNLASVALVYYFSIYGLMARGVFLAVYQFFLLYKNKPYKITFEFQWEHYKKLLKTGIPIFIVGQINPLWATILNSIIFSVGGAVNFGLYALSTIVNSTVGVIPTSFSGVIYPRMNIMYGQGKSISYILKSHLKPMFFQFGVMMIIALIGVFLLPVAVPLLIPKYIDGIEAAQWMLFSPVMLSFGVLNNIYNVVKKQQLYFLSILIGVFIGSAYILLQLYFNGFNLVFFPQGMIIGKFLQQGLSLFFIYKFLIDDQ
ncbi:MAG: hypothetical protein A2W91_07190 [Bacteroidetes bacterium GWF2_38_335]|nr:MAG: hypothetical protein A2W91_07190 [Bacteroidetes bacterium GWF2_38_335]OFY77112.1 MAG: hypothetical protein A2281_14425 [Bacteroidetes bacterium RIFOXYA12_FULL_38_20]HBS85003.1 hypothetical protein [Bacteroidales bacterium]